MNHKRSLSHPSKLANQTTLRFSFAIHFAGAEDSRTKQSTIKSDAKFSFPIHTEKKEEKITAELAWKEIIKEQILTRKKQLQNEILSHSVSLSRTCC